MRAVAASLVANSVAAAAQYVLLVFVARGLGPQAFGSFLYALAVGSFVAVVPNFGLDRVLIRQLIRDRASAASWVSSAVALRSGLAVLAIATTLAVSPWIAPAGVTPATIVLVAISLVTPLFSELCRSILYATGRMTAEAGLRAVGRALMLGAATVAIVAGGSLEHLAAALVLGALFEVVVYAHRTRQALSMGWVHPSRAMAGSLAADAVPVALNTLFVLLYFRLNLVVITSWAGVQAAGQFGAAFTFLQVLQVASGSLASVVLPHFVRQRTTGVRSLAPQVRRATEWLLFGIVPVAAGLALLAPEIVDIVYSSRYQEAGTALQILGWATIFMFLGSLHGTLLIVLDAERTLLWTSCAAAILSVSANAILIPRMGLLGASWATVITEAFVGITCLVAVQRRVGVACISPGIAAALTVGGGVAALLSLAGAPLASRVLVVAVLGAAALGALGRATYPNWKASRAASGSPGTASE